MRIPSPSHVAIIMDGNGRWAARRGLPRLAGHQAGFNRIRSIVKAALAHHTQYLTVYSFSTENWQRPREEVEGILSLLVDNIDREAAELHRQGVQMRHLGRMDGLPEDVQSAILRNCELTEKNRRLVFSFAFNYGGRTEIIDAVRALPDNSGSHALADENTLESHLYTAGMPDVDLLIRTGGELRISNFLLWQSAYAEFYFTRILWPDFTPRQFQRALQVYAGRIRRFGGLQ